MAAEETGYLVKTLWSQDGKIILPDGKELKIDYNEYCPYELVQSQVLKKHTVTGCTNTADSQVIYYWLGKEAGEDLTFTADDTDYYSVVNFVDPQKSEKMTTSRQVEAKDNVDYGALSVSVLNDILAEPDLESGEFIAALNFYCGLKNHSTYGTKQTDSSGITDSENWSSSTLYDSIGFVSSHAIDSSNETFFIKDDGSVYLNELALSIIRENVDYGEPVRVDSQVHSMILDGYRKNAETGAYEYHINYGWGNDQSVTKWYTAEQICNAKTKGGIGIASFYIDLTPELNVKITNDLDGYGAGSMQRGAERINNARTETTVTVDTTKVDGKTLKLSAQWLVESKADAVFEKVKTDFLFSSEYGLYTVNSTIKMNELNSALIVNNANGAIAYGSDKQAELTLNEGSVFAGSGVLSDDVLEALDNYKNIGYNAVAGFADYANGIAFLGGRLNDVITIANDSLVMGSIAMNEGSDNVISIETGSMWIGNLLNGNTTIKFDITSVNDDVMILSSANADTFINRNVTLEASIGLDKEVPLTGVFSLIKAANDDTAFQSAALKLQYALDESTTQEVTLSVNGKKHIIGDLEYSLVADTDDKDLVLSAGWLKNVTGEEETELKLDRYYASVAVETGTAKITKGSQSFIAHVELSDGILDSRIENLQVRSLEVTGGTENALKNNLIQFKKVQVAAGAGLEVSGDQFEQFLEETANVQINGNLAVDGDADFATLQSLLKRDDMKSLHFTGELENLNNLSFGQLDKIDWSFAEGISGTAKNDKITVQKAGTASLGGDIDLLDGSNKLAVEKDAGFTSGGAIANVQTIKVDSCASASFKSTISNLEKLTIANGTVKSDVAVKTLVTVLGAVSGNTNKAASISAGDYSSLVLADVTLFDKNDTITVNKNSSLEISGTLDMGAGNNSLKLGKNSSGITGEIKGVRTLKIEGNDKGKSMFTVNGKYTATDKNDTLTFVRNGKAEIDGGLYLKDGSDTVSLGNNCALLIKGSISSDAGKDKIMIGKGASLEVRHDIVSGSGSTTVTMNKESTFTAGNLIGISKFTMNNLDVSKAEKKGSEEHSATLSSLTGTDNADTVSIGNGALFLVDNHISLGSGNDKFTLGKWAKMNVQSMDLGEGKNSVTLNSCSQLNGMSLAGVNKLDVKSGKQVMSEAGEDTRAAWTGIYVAKNLGLTSGNDTIKTDKYSSLNIAGLIEFNGGSDTVRIGNNAEAVLKAVDISSLKKMTLGKESKVWLSSELVEFVKEVYSEEDLEKDNIKVFDIGSAGEGIAQNFVSYEYETGDDDTENAREGFVKGEALAGWLDNSIDKIDYYGWEKNFTSAKWSNNADLLFTQYDKDGKVLGTSSGTSIDKMAGADTFSISFKDKEKSGAVIYDIALV